MVEGLCTNSALNRLVRKPFRCGSCNVAMRLRSECRWACGRKEGVGELLQPLRNNRSGMKVVVVSGLQTKTSPNPFVQAFRQKHVQEHGHSLSFKGDHLRLCWNTCELEMINVSDVSESVGYVLTSFPERTNFESSWELKSRMLNSDSWRVCCKYWLQVSLEAPWGFSHALLANTLIFIFIWWPHRSFYFGALSKVQ